MIARLLISPFPQAREEQIKRILSDYHLTPTHPDLLYFPNQAKLGIAEARKIKSHFSLKPYSAKGRGVVLEEASSLTPEAQNALLKTLEELPEHGLFILGADSDSKLLPTVVSRCQIERLQDTAGPHRGGGQKNYSEDIQKLLDSSIKERFEYVEKLKDREEFLHSLVAYFHNKLPAHAQFTKDLLQAEEWAKSNVNIRGILEYLMLVMP